MIGLQGGNAHFGSDLHHAVQHCLAVILDRRIIVLIKQVVVDQLVNGFVHQIRIDGACAVGKQRGKVMHLARLAAFQHDRKRGAAFCDDQMLMQRRHREQGRNCQTVFIHAPVGQNQDVRAVVDRLVRFDKQAVDRLAELGIFIIEDRDDSDLEAGYIHLFELEHTGGGQNRVDDLYHAAVFGLFFEQIAVLANVNGGGCDDLLANGVDRRIGDLRENLLEVIKQRLRLLGEHSRRLVAAHRGDRLRTCLRHRQNGGHHVLIGVAERLLQSALFGARVFFDLGIRDFQIL